MGQPCERYHLSLSLNLFADRVRSAFDLCVQDHVTIFSLGKTMRQDASTSSWKTNLLLVLSASATAALLTKWYLEKNRSEISEKISSKDERRKTETAEAGTSTNPISPIIVQKLIQKNTTGFHRRLFGLSNAPTFEQLEAMSDAAVFVNRLQPRHHNGIFDAKNQIPHAAEATARATASTSNTQPNKTPELMLTQAGLPLAGAAAPMLSYQSSYSVLPSHATSINELDELDALRTPENSQEKMADEIVQKGGRHNKGSLLRQRKTVQKK
jgi:hypothetical protein